MSEPTTKAGRELLTEDLCWPEPGPDLRERVAAIEAEARAAVLREVKQVIAALPTPKRHVNDANGNWFTVDIEYGWDCGVEAAVAAIDRRLEAD